MSITHLAVYAAAVHLAVVGTGFVFRPQLVDRRSSHRTGPPVRFL